MVGWVIVDLLTGFVMRVLSSHVALCSGIQTLKNLWGRLLSYLYVQLIKLLVYTSCSILPKTHYR